MPGGRLPTLARAMRERAQLEPQACPAGATVAFWPAGMRPESTLG